ncbi:MULTISPECIES: hypothetical protein [Arthrobacter]|uniref:Uncharacterized protein n=1 Tax=Arthrobacter terricola TaxID=2547396 RepID=A0A4R5KBU6_9MICC|nr:MULTISPECIES: hypothetical protein [Arthrobacter]MBT8162796.1 hypothetical protein [Arthrobacter sp. GN70]TDF92045.1 hypothetical protein E1809_18875 [Arthrobacter terricola]
MIDGLVFPDARECFNDLIDGTQHLGVTVRAVWHLSVDKYGALQGPFPLVLIYSGDGTEGHVDRVDRVTLECYAPGTQAVNVLESIKTFICGTDIETAHGFLDEIKPDQVPKDVPYQSDTLNKAFATFMMTSRPL